MNMASEVQLDSYQAEAFARGLYAIAHVDGLHEREAALVAAFWADTGGTASALNELQRRSAITDEELATALTSADVRRLFLKTALLLTLADGEVSGPEKGLLDRFSKALGLSDQVGPLEEEVKEYLLSHLSHIQNVESVAQVAKKLAL